MTARANEVEDVISLDGLIRAKEAPGREKDLLAAKELRGIREKTG